MFTIDDCAEHNGLGLRVVERKSMAGNLNTGLRPAGESGTEMHWTGGRAFVYVNGGVCNVLELNCYKNNHELVSLTGETVQERADRWQSPRI